MPVYYHKRDGSEIQSQDYGILCIRLACEGYGCPVVGPFNAYVLEFPNAKDVNAFRMKVLESCGFEGMDAPPGSERKELPDFLVQQA